MKKKLLLILLIASMSLSACDSISNKDDKVKETTTETKSEVATETKAETKNETTMESSVETSKELKTIENQKDETKGEETKEEKQAEFEGKAPAEFSKNNTGKYKAYDVKYLRENYQNPNYTGEKVAFLTFDDGISPITSKILDILKKEDVPATFFLLGKNITDDNKSVLKRMYKDGHAIATHSFSHNYEKLYPKRVPDPQHILKEEQKFNEILKSYLGKDFNTRVFRYPGGHMSWNKEGLKKSDALLAENNIEWLDWNTMTGDAQSKKAVQVPRPTTVKKVLDNFDESATLTYNSDLAVILMHDAGDKQLTAEALPQLIKHLKELGYTFGVIS